MPFRSLSNGLWRHGLREAHVLHKTSSAMEASLEWSGDGLNRLFNLLNTPGSLLAA